MIVTLGNFATKLLLDTKEGITKLRGREFGFSRAGIDAVLLPTLHPSAVLRSGGGKALAESRADFVRVKRVLAAGRDDDPAHDDRLSPRRRDAVAADARPLLEAGDVISLVGDLGAGKTAFAQGVARGLGVEGPVTSPTFTIVQEYQGRLPVAHVDVYRLDTVQDLYDLGFDELVDDGRVTIVEWGDLVAPALPCRSPRREDRRRRCRYRTGAGALVPRRPLARPAVGDRAGARPARVRRLMLLLGIETATRRVGVVLASEERDARPGRVGRLRRQRPAPPRGAPGARDRVLLRADRRTGSTTCRRSRSGSARGCSPGCGSGVTTAKVLAQTLRVPMIPIPSLDLLAYPLRHSHGLVVPAIDARRNEIYYALY